MSNALDKLLSDSSFKKLTFEPNKPVELIITGMKEKDNGITLTCSVQSNENKNEVYYLYTNYYMKEVQLNPTLSMIIRALLYKQASDKINKLGDTASIDEKNQAIIATIFENFDSEIMGRTIEVVFKPIKDEYQNIKSIKDLGFKDASSDSKEVVF